MNRKNKHGLIEQNVYALSVPSGDAVFQDRALPGPSPDCAVM